jgi:hypothetical protein
MFQTILLPRIRRSYLLLVAAGVWTFAGGMLLFRGFTFNASLPAYWELKLAGSIIGGLLFFRLLFNRISGKHVQRIQSMPEERLVVFSFFSVKSYLMMFSMIALGITLRKSGLVAPEYLSMIYITMGIPLLMSSFRFYYAFFRTQN